MREPLFHGFHAGFIAGYRDKVQSTGLQTTFPGRRDARQGTQPPGYP
jgi:hypothetical protein